MKNPKCTIINATYKHIFTSPVFYMQYSKQCSGYVLFQFTLAGLDVDGWSHSTKWNNQDLCNPLPVKMKSFVFYWHSWVSVSIAD